MTKTVLLDAAGNPIGAPTPKPVILDAQGEWLDGDNKGELVLKRTQEVPDEFWAENAHRREQSRANGPGWMMSAVRMPEIIQEQLFRTYPHLSPKNWTTAKDITYAREMVRCLKLMGEDRCITTVWSF